MEERLMEMLRANVPLPQLLEANIYFLTLESKKKKNDCIPLTCEFCSES